MSEPGAGSGAPVRLERNSGANGHVATVVLCRPDAANALSWGLVRAMRAVLAGFSQAGAMPPRVVIVTGEGDKAFCAGADLNERRAMSLAETRSFLAELNALANDLAALPCVTIAALNGAALGGGLELALCCDLRVASDTAKLGLPEVRLGIIPGAGGTQRLPRVIGVAAAKELILTGARIDAQRALALGLVSAVVPSDKVRAEADRWAQEIAAAGPLAVAQAKRAMDEGWGRPLDDALACERAAYEVVLTSDDRNEGLQAFAAKRAPVFSGK